MGHDTRQRGSLPSAKNKALGKEGFEFFFKISSLPSAFTGALDKVFSKKKSLSSARSGTLDKEFFLKKTFFAECQIGSTRQSIFQKKIFAECQIWDTRQRIFFKKKLLCRVPNSRHSAKKDVAEHGYAGQPMPSAALLPSAILCRVPDF